MRYYIIVAICQQKLNLLITYRGEKMNDYKQILENQKNYFASGATLNVNERISKLKKLYNTIEKYEDGINLALKNDLGKCSFESYMSEIGLVKSEISYFIKHGKSLSKKRKVHTPASQFLSNSYVLPSPYGNALIISPWNYPFLLSIEPLVDAVIAGNTVILKPSEYSPDTSSIIKKIIDETFRPEEAYVALGDADVSKELLKLKYDIIFFTGSKNVGQIILNSTIEHLTPCVLELGGKSPCIIDDTANLKLAARRIVFGKFLNCGQTCVAPDYLLCQKDIKEEFLKYIKDEILRQFGSKPLENEDYGKIISMKHFNRLLSLINAEKVIIGGDYDSTKMKIAPTVLNDVSLEDKVMQEEIFGPILPILTFDTYDEAFDIISKNPTPLAFYIFSNDKAAINHALTHISFGGGCVNDVVIHLANSEMGFGGVGSSGMGAYHGKTGFDTFSHLKSIVDKKQIIDMPMRYQPYKSKLNKKILKIFMR